MSSLASLLILTFSLFRSHHRLNQLSMKIFSMLNFYFFILFRPQIPTLRPERTNEDLPAPQKLLTAPSSNRFTPNLPVANEQSSRFTRPEEYSSRTNGNTEQNRPYSMEIRE